MTLFSDSLIILVDTVMQACRARGYTLALAESCTGGLLATAMTETPRASDIFLGCAVTYSNEAKQAMLGVKRHTLTLHGAVSEETAREMAIGASERFQSDLSAAITGIAGPGGGTKEKPVGTVYIATALQGDIKCRHFAFTGDRASIRMQSVVATADMLADTLGLKPV